MFKNISDFVEVISAAIEKGVEIGKAEITENRYCADAYEEGRSQGYDEGYSQGYDEGHSEGYDEGHSQGYEEAQKELNDSE